MELEMLWKAVRERCFREQFTQSYQSVCLPTDETIKFINNKDSQVLLDLQAKDSL